MARIPESGRSGSFVPRILPLVEQRLHGALDALRDLSNKLGSKLRIIIITQEDSDKIAPILTPYISERIGVALDHDKKVFGSFGVDFVPFSVLIDAKNRVLWMGNPQSMTSSFIQKIVQ